MSKTPPPLLGYNNNVRHRGRVFHIQTEDSGIKRPRVITHLFGDGGRILKTTKTDYAEHMGRDDLTEVVRRTMKEQHKAMFIALRRGDLDAVIEEAFGPFEQPPAAPKAPASTGAPISEAVPSEVARSEVAPATAASAESPPAEPAVSPPNLAPRQGRVLSDPGAAVAVAREAMPSITDAEGPEDRESDPEAGRYSIQDAPAESAGRYAVSRPSAIFGEKAPKQGQSIFGDDMIGEKSLDEVILSYLAEDLESPPGK